MLRMKDFQCVCCGAVEEIMVRVGDPDPEHCGSTMEHIWISAPGVHYKPHFSHTLNRKVSTYKEEEREIEKKGWWIASKSEANSSYGTDIFKDDVTIKQNNEAQIRKHVEKQAQKLVADGRLRVGKNGWESVGDN